MRGFFTLSTFLTESTVAEKLKIDLIDKFEWSFLEQKELKIGSKLGFSRIVINQYMECFWFFYRSYSIKS